ncbi:MAG: hypothetical protein IJZ68_06175 [Bacteroidaceae bacterium]|nr:hypothetical protein [Bacteroidaceae bacterium]
MKRMNFSARHVCKILLTILLCLVMLFTCAIMTGCSAETTADGKPRNLSSRYVVVEDALIDEDYSSGLDVYRADGSSYNNWPYSYYVVDRVSRYVYIYVEDTGSYSSGMMMTLCYDADGNPQRYTGELPE